MFSRSVSTLPPHAKVFRGRVIDAFGRDLERCYIDRDIFVGVCPVCDGALAVRFAGTAARVDLACERHCAATGDRPVHLETHIEAATLAVAPGEVIGN